MRARAHTRVFQWKSSVLPEKLLLVAKLLSLVPNAVADDLPIEQAQIIRMSMLLIRRCHCSSRCCSIRFDSDKFVSLFAIRCITSKYIYTWISFHLNFCFQFLCSAFILHLLSASVCNEKTTIQFSHRDASHRNIDTATDCRKTIALNSAVATPHAVESHYGRCYAVRPHVAVCCSCFCSILSH